MGGIVELPVWLVVVGTAFAVIALVDRVLGPTVRWYFRKRFYRAIDEINERLQLKIQPFKLTKRKVLIERLVHDLEVLSEVETHMAETGEPRAVVMAKVERYARETVPSFSAYIYFSVGARISKLIAQALYRVRLGDFNDEALAGIDSDATVVFVMNHRSNADYLLVTYLAATRSALSYAVGEWARIWPLSYLIRSMGAYYIRRRSRNALYRKVLARYVRMATDGGVAQAIFPEGGLSRDGKLAPPKLGLLSYIVTGFDPEKRDVVFVPVGLNYDRVLEDRVLVSSNGTKGPLRFPVDVWATLGFIRRLIWRRFKGQFYRFGYACVVYGEPLSLSEFMKVSPDRDIVKKLGKELSCRIGRAIPVLPVSLVSTVLLASPGPMSLPDIKVSAKGLFEKLKKDGARTYIPRGDIGYATDVGMRMLTLRKFVVEKDGIYSVVSKEVPLMRYYANAIAHLSSGKTGKS